MWSDADRSATNLLHAHTREGHYAYKTLAQSGWRTTCCGNVSDVHIEHHVPERWCEARATESSWQVRPTPTGVHNLKNKKPAGTSPLSPPASSFTPRAAGLGTCTPDERSCSSTAVNTAARREACCGSIDTRPYGVDRMAMPERFHQKMKKNDASAARRSITTPHISRRIGHGDISAARKRLSNYWRLKHKLMSLSFYCLLHLCAASLQRETCRCVVPLKTHLHSQELPLHRWMPNFSLGSVPALPFLRELSSQHRREQHLPPYFVQCWWPGSSKGG